MNTQVTTSAVDHKVPFQMMLSRFKSCSFCYAAFSALHPPAKARRNFDYGSNNLIISHRYQPLFITSIVFIIHIIQGS